MKTLFSCFLLLLISTSKNYSQSENRTKSELEFTAISMEGATYVIFPQSATDLLNKSLAPIIFFFDNAHRMDDQQKSQKPFSELLKISPIEIYLRRTYLGKIVTITAYSANGKNDWLTRHFIQNKKCWEQSEGISVPVLDQYEFIPEERIRIPKAIYCFNSATTCRIREAMASESWIFSQILNRGFLFR